MRWNDANLLSRTARVPCDECDAGVTLVVGSYDELYDEDGDLRAFTCNACDEKVNPEDYEFLHDDDGA